MLQDTVGKSKLLILMVTKFSKEQDELIVRACMNVGVNVDKDELVKALAYDRHQYEKGYVDGHKDRDEEIIKCKDCEWYLTSEFDAMSLDCTVYKRHCKQVDKLVEPDFFCGWAERSKDADN